MKNNRSGRPIHRLLKIIGIIAAAALVALYLLLPVGMGAFAAIRPPKACGSAPAGFEDVKLTTADGVDLAGWYAKGTNDAAILLLHGSKSNRDTIRPYAEFLAKNGFGVLAIDMQGSGLSSGRANGFGWESANDVGAAVSFLEMQPDVKAIGALGISLGGEVLLSAASEYPKITAIVSDGASHRCTADYVALPSNSSIVRSWTTRVMYWSTGLFTGSSEPMAITESIANAPGTSLLLIAAGTVQKEIDYNKMYCEIAGNGATLRVVPGVGHTGAYSADSAKYAETVTNFFKTSLNHEQEPQ